MISERCQAMVEDYRNGMTMPEVGKKFGVTPQRVEQLIKKIENKEGVKIHRHYKHKPKELWSCVDCGKTRKVIVGGRGAKTLRCFGCSLVHRALLNALPNEQIEKYISRLMNGEKVTKIAKEEQRNYQDILSNIWFYLRRNDRLEEWNILSRGRSSRWLERKYGKGWAHEAQN